MLNFKNIENLVTHMFDQLDGDNPVSVVANKDLAVSVVQELLEYNNVILKYANVNDQKYDKEYIVTLHNDLDIDTWDVAIEPLYSYENEKYLGTDGYVLFHEDVNSKAIIDMQNNENIELSGHDWFVMNDENDIDDDTFENSKDSDDEVDYNITLQMTVDTDDVEKIFNNMFQEVRTEMVDMISRMSYPFPMRFF